MAEPPGFDPAPICRRCGYELTGLRVEGSCPECGEQIYRRDLQQPDSLHGYATTALTLGLIGLVFFCVAPFSFPVALTGVGFAEFTARRARQGRGGWQCRGTLLAGRIVSWTAAVLAGLALIAYLPW